MKVMKVVKNEVTFGQLKLGDAFKSTNNSYSRVYIKTENVFIHTDGTGVRNAVCLNDGLHTSFDKNIVIQPLLDAEFIYQ